MNNKFLWGAATSAFQIEGGIRNDMTDWEEQGNFRRNGENPLYGKAANHWENWKADFDLLKILNLNAYRFSVEWARLQPQPGSWDNHALDTYERMLDRLLELDITPMLTLHHFTHPTWFHAKSPWHSDASVAMFIEFVAGVVERLGDRVNLFVTFNEPLVWLLAAYGDAKFPPGFRDLQMLMDSLRNMLIAHKQAYSLIHQKNPQAQVGIAKNMIAFEPLQPANPFEKKVTQWADRIYNDMIPEAFQTNQLVFRFPFLFDYNREVPLDNCVDFWGVNYYYRLFLYLKLSTKQPVGMKFQELAGQGTSDLGWENYAQGLLHSLDRMAKSGKDLYITENGIADADDQHRDSFIRNHLQVVENARETGLPLKGYFHWSLIDNYEWLEGDAAKFGLVEVRKEDGYRRVIRESAWQFAQLIAESVNKEIPEQQLITTE